MNSPAETDGDDAGTVLGNFEEHWHGQIKVGARRVAPSTIVTGQGKVWWTEVCCGNEDGRIPRIAPFGVIATLDFEAGPAA